MTTRTIQELFVDRLKEIDRFRKSLDGASARRIILVTAPAGMGKSWLLQQFAHEARARNARSVLIDFGDGQAYDALTLLRRFRDELNSPYFNALTQAINEATTPRLSLNEAPAPSGGVDISFGSDNRLNNVALGDIAGGNIVKDNLFIVQTDNPLVLQAIEDRVTTVFFDCLRALVQQTQVVFLFDTYERNSLEPERWAPNAADRWITQQLLRRIRDNQLANVLVVLAGVRGPEFGAEWNAVLGRLPLELFTLNDVSEYLRANRGLTLSDAEVRTLYAAVQGNPQLMGIIGDNLEQASRPAAADEEW